ncbi:MULTISPECIES: 16S rRNA (uracil(1498)-N(3))-methyltransferase [Methylotenera]|uniref:16S rRNA (uracil(1498)-N(3))-methyltransferase n=1 Tax=Methylotenera TaxID=359407 RepID=UPI000370C167|nr:MULTISPECIES: 16S rRNA (uracil(1498)-N(3))-methyltransferase [Methylotenera]
MSNTRFYSAEKLILGALAPLSASAATHATRALRLNIGDKLKLFNGDGFDYSCELIGIKKNEVIAKVLAGEMIENESPLNITLLQGISSGDRMDYTIQKAVELGVKAIQPISTERSVVKLNQERAQKRLEHWQNIVTSACEQSGRAFVPQVLSPISLSNWLAYNPQGNATRILLNPVGALKIAALTKPVSQIQLLIGAEGGLSQSEIDAATSQGFQSIILGPRILRTETAALTAIASMQTLWGDY